MEADRAASIQGRITAVGPQNKPGSRWHDVSGYQIKNSTLGNRMAEAIEGGPEIMGSRGFYTAFGRSKSVSDFYNSQT